MRNKLRRPLAFLLSAVMIVTMSGTPVHAVADRGQPETGLCEHHTAHTDDCGYTEETPGTPCGHEHTEDCYIEVTECVHEHTPECYPEETEDSVSDNEATPANAEEREPENCPHICDGESGCITEKLDCRHEHDSECGYTESTPGTPCTYVCEICNPQDSGEADEEPETGIIKQEQCSCLTLCTEGQINPDCPVCGAEDAGLSDCKGKAEKEDTKQPEDTGICKHHQEHDDACGYQPESEDSEGSPCTYECRICPIEDLIAALPDKVTEDNAEDVRGQIDKILALFGELTEDEQEQIDLSRCYELQGALDEANDPTPLSTGDVDLYSTYTVTFTEAECSGGCQGHKITQSYTQIEGAKILVESGTHNITFSGLNLRSAAVGIMPGGTMNLTLVGTNKIVGSGRGFYVPVGATLVITEQSTGSLDISLTNSTTAAGIGGAYYDPNGNVGDFSCGMVVINGGTITAAGRGDSAGIGGASYDPNFGNGGNITITGGHVTATGSDGAPGIGGGKDADSDGSLTLSSADVLAENTTLGAKGTYTINGDPTEDMIVVPELVYTGEILDTSEIRIDDSKTGTATYFGQTFRVQASADGWVLQDLGEVKEGGEYTAVFKKDNKEISKTFTVAQSGTQFVGDGTVKTYKDGTECSDFTADDTITVKATPTATGEAPAKAAARLKGNPTAGQMAVFVGTTQVSLPADAVDGTYTMSVSAADVLVAAGGPGTGITLTAKFVGNNNMADAAGTVPVNISAVAKVVNGSSTTFVGALADAFTKGNSGATVTLLSEVDLGSNYIEIIGRSTFTLDLNGQTVKAAAYNAFLILGGSLTIQDSGTGGKIEGSSTAIKVTGGTLSIESGTVSGFYGVEISGGTVNISGGVISGEETGLWVYNSGKAVLSGGTLIGRDAVFINANASVTLKNLLAEGYAYHRNNLPVTKAEGWVDSNTWGEVSLDTKATLTGTVTVKKCNHTGEGVYEYTPNEGAETHDMTCLACGYAGAAESCAYSDDYGHDETNHWQTCTLCGGKKTEAHGWVHQCTSATGIIRRSCDKCEIETVVGTVSITPDFSVTYGKTGSATLVCTAELADGYSLEPADSADNCWVLMALSDGKSWNLGRELEVKLPADLPAGEYWYNASPRLSYQGNNTIVKRFNVLGQVTVTPAPLTVTGAAAKDRTYDGTNSVQITGVTLDGVLNSDNVSVDLTGLTGTLSGSDAETYTSVTLPRLTLTGGAASNYTLPQSMGAVPASVTISKATLTATGATIKTRPYKPIYHTAEVSGVTFTGLVNGETLALGEDYTAFGNYDDPNAGENKSATIFVELKSSAKANNYTLPKDSSVNATGTITKASQTAPSITGLPSGTITYGDSFTLHTESGVSCSASGAANVDSSGKVTVTGVGKAAITATKPGSSNYEAAENQIIFTAVPKALAVTGLTVTDRAYDGTSTVEITGVTLAGILNGDDVSVATTGLTGTLNGSNAGTYTNLTLPAMILTGADAENYTVTRPAGAVPASVTIRKAAPLTPKTGDLAVVNKQAHTYTYGLGALRPDVQEGISLGSTAVTYELGTVSLGSYYDSGAKIDGQTLTLPIKAVESDSETKIGTITVTIHTQNFEDMTATIDVRSVNKQSVDISGVTLTGRTYNGSPIEYQQTATASVDGKTVNVNGFVYTWDTPNHAAPVNAGNYTLTVSVDPEDQNYTGSTTIPVVIEQAEIRVTAPSKTIYVGETAPVFSAADCNITGLVQGENLKTPPTVAYAEAPDTSKTGSVTVTASGAEVPEGGNYKDRIVYENGTLTITSKPLPPAKYTVTVQAGKGGTASASPTSAEKGTKITLTATPDSGYHFKEWQVISGGATISGNSFTMPATNVTVKAVFEKDSDPPQATRYSVTVQAGTGGTASASPTSAEKGTKITLTATPDSGYHFKEWQVISGGVTISNNSFTMPDTNVTVKAVFEKDGSTPPQPTRYSVTVQAGTGGTASASPTSAEKGTKITLTATPDSGYHFKEWQVISGGVTISNNSFTMPDTNVTVKAVFVKNSNGGGNSGGSGSGGGSSSGGNGSSSGDNGSSGGGSTIVARPDETKPDTPTTSQTKPATPDKNGNVALDNGAVQSAINAAKNDAKKNGNTANGVAVVIPVSPQKGQTSFSVTIKAQTLDTLVREKVKRLEINIEGVIVEGMDAGLLKWLDTASANGDIILRVKQISQASLSKEAKAAIGTRPVYDLSLVYLAGGKETPITDFDGHTIAVRLPYAPAKDEKTGNLYAVYVDGKGKVEWLTKSSYDPDLGTVVFEAGHFSIYGIGYKNPAPDFTDIKNHWAEDNIIFVASRGLLTGTGNNQFSPNMGMTRGMFVTALGRLAGIDPDSYKTGKFTDVKADAYYAPYVNWAAEKGIVNGTTATTFSPDTNITREQMAVIMANYAKKLGYDLPAAHEAVTFADNAQISGWAAKEVKAMQQAGILAGKGGNRFDPKGTATRAEVATVLRRFVEIVIDPQTAQGWMQNHSGSWQYLKNGKPATGWLQDDKKWYWLDSNGWMFTGGWKQIDGKWYYFYSDGSMAVNTTIDGYTIGPDGARK